MQNKRSELMKRHLTIAIEVNNADHGVDFLIGNKLSHANQNVSNFRCAQEPIFIKVDESKRRCYLGFCELLRPVREKHVSVSSLKPTGKAYVSSFSKFALVDDVCFRDGITRVVICAGLSPSICELTKFVRCRSSNESMSG
jgi:hypothetical protein